MNFALIKAATGTPARASATALRVALEVQLPQCPSAVTATSFAAAISAICSGGAATEGLGR
jgi:hypothetical protein